MSDLFQIRPATPDDRLQVTQLFRRSYPRLLPRDYAPRLLRDALPVITTAQPALLACGTYFVAVCCPSGAVVGAGGWTDISPTRGVSGTGQGHMRHVATDPDWLRRGVARALLRHSCASAWAQGITRMTCMSTLTARRFYAAMGFHEQGEVELTLAPGVHFPAVQMARDLAGTGDDDLYHATEAPDGIGSVR